MKCTLQGKHRPRHEENRAIENKNQTPQTSHMIVTFEGHREEQKDTLQIGCNG